MKVVFGTILSAYLFFCSISIAQPNQTTHSSPKEAFNEGELIVQFIDKNADVRAFSDHFQPLELRPKKMLSRRMNIWLFEYDPKNLSANQALEIVREYPEVLLAQLNHIMTLRDVTSPGEIFPNDPQFTSQWALHNTGQSGGTPDADIDAPEAWDIATGGTTATGDEIVVAIVDGGADINHVDIDYWKNVHEIPNNGVDDDNNGYVDDYDGWNAYNSTGNIPSDGHGTHVSGISGAIGDNGTGVSGVNWNVKIMPVAGSSSSEATVVEAYGYVLEMRARYNASNGAEGAFVVVTNSSFGVDFGDPNNYPIWCAMYDSMGAQGVLSCAATANLNIDIDIEGDVPTACPSDWLVSVTNTTRNDVKNSGAAYGLTTIDLGAPGTSILSTLPGNSYGNLTGTSMATPTVAGVVALMYSAAGPGLMQAHKSDPAETALLVKQWVMEGVDPIASLQGITVTGGRLNAFNSLLLVKSFADSLDPNPPANIAAHSDYTTPASMLLTWDDPTNYAGGDTLLPGNFTIEIERESVFVASVAGGTGQYTDTGLNDGQLYSYQLFAKTIATDSTSDKLEVFWHAGGSPVPSAPASLVCAGDTSTATLTWVDPATQEDGTPLDDLDHLNIYRDGVLLDSVPEGTQTYTDTPPPGFFYNYTVTAVDNETPPNESLPSNTAGGFIGSTPRFLVWVGPEATGAGAASGDSIFAALVANGESAFLTNNLFEFGNDLSIYDGVFVVLGIFSNNHTIGASDPEGAALETYLSGGGNLYLEGGDCFNYDPGQGGYNIRPWFDLNEGSDGSGDVAGIIGLNELSAFLFPYNGENNWMDELRPINSIPVWENNANTDISGVYNPSFGNGGKAIGVVPSFGGLVDNAAPLHPGKRSAPKIASTQPEANAVKSRLPVSGQREEFVKKAAYYPELKTRISRDFPLYKVTPNGLEVLANTKEDLMAAYLEIFFPQTTGQIVVNPSSFSDTLFADQTSVDTMTIGMLNGPLPQIIFDITETPAVNWLDVNPTSGTLTANQSDDITVTFNAAGLITGDYATTLEIASNDPVTPLLTIPVELHVIGVPVITAADSLVFDTIAVNTQDSRVFYIFNQGNASLVVHNVVSTNNFFTVDSTTFGVPANDSTDVIVTFAPTTVGLHSGWLKFASNDPNTDTLRVYVEGFADPGVGIAGDQALPQQFAVSRNYPNPFNPSTTINYQLPRMAEVSLIIYNVLGQRVRTLVQGQKSPGYYQAIWDGRNDAGLTVGSGIYIYRFWAVAPGESEKFLQIRKMIFMK